MCSIFGGIGLKQHFNPEVVAKLREAAKDRGRDGGRMETYEGFFPGGDSPISAALGNWRATPTPELAQGRLQPYDGMVHNGTIANDAELGKRDGEIDSEVLARHIDRRNVVSLTISLSRVKGSYALAAWTGDTILLATNYKPLYYAEIDGAFYFSSMARHFDHVLARGRAPVAVPAYSALDLLTGCGATIGRTWSNKALAICSAGLDSVVAATKLVREGYDVTLLHFLYGCHAQGEEVSRIPAIAKALGCGFLYVPVDYRFAKEASTLLRDGAPIADKIAGAEYAHEWVPARNLMFLALASAVAEAKDFHTLAIGINLEEAGAFPDNEEEFTIRFNELLPLAVQNGYALDLVTPVGNLMKHEIVKLGVELGAPLELTWSCYRAGKQHCGECGPCFMRREAFKRNGLVDPVFAAAENPKSAADVMAEAAAWAESIKCESCGSCGAHYPTCSRLDVECVHRKPKGVECQPCAITRDQTKSAEAAYREGLADNGVLLDDVIGDTMYGAND
jgi:7-cyano-7-deazaguanine synthase